MRPGKTRVDAAAKRDFLAGLRAGLKRDGAAKRAGFTANAFYYARRGDPVFALAWAWAVDLSAADAHAARIAAAPFDPDEAVIAPNAGRRLQLRPIRRALFDARRKRIYLDHFAATADARAAAAAAGVSPCTVSAHRRSDPEFAAAEADALAIAYASLEAEAVRQRLEAQRNLREGLCPTGEIAQEFDRVIRLLARYERKSGRIGLRTPGVGRERRMSFDDAIALLDRKLRALGVRRGLIPPAALPPPPVKDDESEEEK
ncbi:MAG TPA: hypothetical protein VGO55_11065 [Allosphingosinicella sp.]|nr:hypothetical protein [Allosphingosinicella sp.]